MQENLTKFLKFHIIYIKEKKEGDKMSEKMNNENTYQTTLRLPIELYEAIKIMAKKNERKPAEQIRHMLKKYIEIKTET